MSLRKGGPSQASKKGIGGIWITLCVIFGAGLAFLAAAFDGAMAIGSSFARFKVVFLVSWPVGTLLCYLAIRDLQEKWSFLRNPNREVTSLAEPKVIVWLVVIASLGLLYLIFGDVSLTP